MQQVMVRSEAPVALRPLVTQAISQQARALAHGIKRTKQELARFEHQYNMSSADFAPRFQQGTLAETGDFIDWWMELEALNSSRN